MPGTAQGGRGAGAERSQGLELAGRPGCCCGRAPERLPAARLGQRGSRRQEPLLGVFPISGSQHGSADLGNAVQKLVEGVRPQQCCGELCCQIGFYYFIFSVKFMG